ncbi:transcriptional regulator, partial [Staphylococcus pseudintermedius]
LTEKGVALARALEPLETWAHDFIDLEEKAL